ncbi:MAG: response regulator [Promethearchaeota archaeon]|nr:MAG: response regulator [Candidatus Lokiarchaeota archaeon]
MEEKNEKIDFLLIEDNQDTIKFLIEYLKSRGYSIKFARRVKEGLEVLKDNLPSIILLDILLPDKKGYEIISSIKSNPVFKNVLIYFLTAIPKQEVLKEVERYNIEGVIEKPFNLDEIEPIFEILDKKPS